MPQFIAPTHAPSLSVLVDAIPASRADVARHIGVSPRTLAAWITAEQAPRAVMVALFMESDFGRQSIDADLVTRYRNAFGLADCLRREVSTLRTRIDRLERLGDFGASNDPYSSAATVAARPGVALEVVAQFRQLR